jgi:hypothetical protein
MVTAYSPILKLALPVQGELSGTWGDVVNDNITSMVEQAIAGRAVINTWTTDSHTLTTANGTTSESRCAMLELTDTGTALTGAGTVICPTASKIYIVKNAAGQNITVTTVSGTGILVPNGRTTFLFCDGTNVVEALTHTTSLQLGTSTVVTAVLDEDNMASDSATALATQQSIKAYVDAQVGAFDSLAEVLAVGNTSGANDIIVDNGQKITVNTIDETTAAAGVTIDSVLLKDDGVNATNLEVTNIKANDGTAAGSIADSTGVVTVASAVLTTADINGGTVDDVVIGGSTPAAATVTTATANTSLNIAGTVTVTSILDEDNMASDDPAGLATQQSIKAYVDAQVGAFDSLAEVLAVGNTTGGTDLLVSTGDDITFADNSKAIFGAGSDLQIYHSGTQSFITENGTGDLNIQGNNLVLEDPSGNNYLFATSGGAVSLFHNASSKLATSATGIDVTGTVTADGLTVDTDAYRRLLLTYPDAFTSKLQVGFSNFYVQGSAANDRLTIANNSSGQTHFENQSKTSMVIDNSGDISFYEDTGTTPKFFWDASAERLGIGTSSPSAPLHVNGGSSTGFATVKHLELGFTANRGLTVSTSQVVAVDDLVTFDSPTATYGQMAFKTAGAERLRIDSSGNVGIGTDSPDNKLQISDSTVGTDPTADDSNFIKLTNKDVASVNEVWGLGFSSESGGTDYLGGFVQAFGNYTSNFNTSLIFGTRGTSGNATERMRIDESGNVGIGTDSPSLELSVDGDIWQGNRSGVEIGRITNAAGWYDFGGSSNVNGAQMSHVGTLRFLTASTERMRIDSSGNLLVGRTISTLGGGNGSLLQIGSASASGSGAGLTIHSGTAGVGDIQFADGTTGADSYRGLIRYEHSTNNMNFWVNASERMRID